MDPVALIVSALAAGASGGGNNVAAPTIQGVYGDLKGLIGRKFAGKGDVHIALASLESKPDSQARRDVLAEELQAAGAAHERDMVVLAQKLLDLVQRGEGGGPRYTAVLTSSGAIAQGPGAVAAASGGIATGSRDVVGASADPTQPASSSAMSPEAEIASLQTQLDNRRQKLAALEQQRVTALGNEAATLVVLIAQESKEIKQMEDQLDALKSR